MIAAFIMTGIVLFAIWFAAVIGQFVYGKCFARWAGWGSGIATFAAVIWLSAPSITALNRVSCQSADDYQACIEGD